MTIKFACPACGRKFAARDEHAGRQTRCPACGAEMVVPKQDPVDRPFEPQVQLPPVPAENRVAAAGPGGGRAVAKAAAIVGLIIALGAAAEGYARLRMAGKATAAEKVVAARAPELPAPVKPTPPKPRFDFTQWKLSDSLQWSHPQAECVAFSPDGRLVAVGGGAWRPDPLPAGGYGEGIETGVTQLWDIVSGEAQGRFLEPHDMIRSLAFLPGGGSLAVGDRQRIKVIDVKTGVTRYVINESGFLFIVINRQLGILANSASGYFWDIKNGDRKPCFVSATMDRAVFSGDGRYLFTNGAIWDCKSESRILATDADCAAFSHDNLYLGAVEGTWEISSRVPVWTDNSRRSADSRVTGLSFTPDDNFIISTTLSGLVEVRESRTGRIRVRFQALPEVYGMALSPDGQYLVTVGKTDRDGESPIKIWRPAVKAAP